MLTVLFPNDAPRVVVGRHLARTRVSDNGAMSRGGLGGRGDPIDQHTSDEPSPPRVKRKLKMLADEDIGSGIVHWLSLHKRIKLIQSPRGRSDDDVWADARRQKAVLLTGNRRDFWDDGRFPIQECPGLIVVVGSTEDERFRALQFALSYDEPIMDDNARWGTCRDLKIKVTPTGAVHEKRYVEGAIESERLQLPLRVIRLRSLARRRSVDAPPTPRPRRRSLSA